MADRAGRPGVAALAGLMLLAMPAAAQTRADAADALRPTGTLAPPATETALPVALAAPVLPLPALPDADPAAEIRAVARREDVLKARGITDPAALRGALAAYRDGRIEDGDRLAAAFPDGAVRALLEWTALRRGVHPFDRFAAFLAAHADWPAAPMLRRRAEERLLADALPADRVRAFFSVQAPQTAAGAIALAFAARAHGEEAKAATLVRGVWRREPFSPEMESRLTKAFGASLGRADHAARLEMLLAKELDAAALRAAARIDADHERLAKARIAVANGVRKAEAALAAVPATLRGTPSYRFAQAQMLRRAKKLAEAAAAMDGVATDPAATAEGDAWWEERRVLARQLLDAGDARAAYRVVAGHGAGSVAMRIDAEFQAGWIALRALNDSAAAATHFGAAAALATTPISRARGLYWQARAADAGGEMAAAQALFRKAADSGIAYYGQLARPWLDAPAALALAPPRVPDLAARLAFGARDDARAIELLYALDERPAALMLAREIARSADADMLAALVSVATTAGDAVATLAVGKIATQRGMPLEAEAFPTFGLPGGVTLADTIDRAMLLAVARQESAFAADAVSQAGARGLMQLMPATARTTAKQAGLAFDVGRLTSDPAYNAQLGAAHLADLWKDWKGSPILVFAAYNAGGGNVAKWIQAYGDPRKGGVDPVDWVERIPFSETRNYVQRVMEGVAVYRHRLGASAAAPPERERNALR